MESKPAMKPITGAEAIEKAHVLTPGQLKVAKGVLEPDHFLFERNILTRSYYADLFKTIDSQAARIAELEEALGWYATNCDVRCLPNNDAKQECTKVVWSDSGMRAREALKAKALGPLAERRGGA